MAASRVADATDPASAISPPGPGTRNPPDWDEHEWARLQAWPGSPARNAALAARLEQLARSEPLRAMALATAERNLLLRETLVQAALRGWADTAPEAAAQWAVRLDDPSKRGAAVETVFGRLVLHSPEDAPRLAGLIFQQDPGGATGHACALAGALCAAGRFDLAARFASAPGDLGAVGKSILTAQTYQAWSRFQPEEAARAAAALPDPAARLDALNAVIGGWGEADPAGLTRHIAQLPAEPARIQMLGQSLRQWAALDPDAAAAWVAQNDATLGVDDGVAAVAGGGFLKPETAATWVDGIANPGLRSQTVLALLRNWASTDPDAARNYFERTSHLSPDDRRQAAALFATPSGS